MRPVHVLAAIAALALAVLGSGCNATVGDPGGGGGDDGISDGLSRPDAGMLAADAASLPDAASSADADTGIRLSQNTSDDIIGGHSIECIKDGTAIHLENNLYRVFDLPAMGVTGALEIDKVTLGIEVAEAPAGSQPISVKLYTLSGALTMANLGDDARIAQAQVMVTNQANSYLDVPFSAPVPAGAKLVVEVFLPNGETNNNSFILGANAAGQSGPSYLRSVACQEADPDLVEPTDLADVASGFPDVHYVLSAHGTPAS